MQESRQDMMVTWTENCRISDVKEVEEWKCLICIFKIKMTEFDDGLKVTHRKRVTLQMIPGFLSYTNGKHLLRNRKLGEKSPMFQRL